MVQHAISSLVAKTMKQYVIPTLDSCVTTITSFDLWMFRFGHDTSIFVINFINSCGCIAMWQLDFSKPWYIWCCNGNTCQGSPIIVQSIGQTNCLCEGRWWQHVHPNTSSYFNYHMWSFGTCSSLTRVVFWPCFYQSRPICL